MKNSRTQKLVSILAVIAVASALYFVFPGMIDAQQEEKTFVTMEGAVITTSGEVIDPVLTTATVDFDPDKFLREF
ncbi:MAG: copper oxidase, partial [Nitrosopumilaceae archaeon]